MNVTTRISPSDMVLFAIVGREGSFTAAASALGITKQSVSERVSKLERQLAVRLFDRTTRSLRLTQLGSSYFERCQALAEQVDRANAELQRGRAEIAGLVRVASPRLYARHFLTPIVTQFLAKHPSASVEVVIADRRVSPVEEGLDLAIVIGDLSDSSFVARRLGDAETMVVASPSFLARHGRPTVKTLPRFRCVGLAPIEPWSVRGASCRVEPVFIAPDLELCHDAALAGVGLARLPRFLCRDALRDGRLVALFGGATVVARPIWAVFTPRPSAPVVRAFIDALPRAGERRAR